MVEAIKHFILSKPKYSIASNHLTTRNLWNTVNWECLALFLCSYMPLGILILEDTVGYCIWYLIWMLLFDVGALKIPDKEASSKWKKKKIKKKISISWFSCFVENTLTFNSWWTPTSILLDLYPCCLPPEQCLSLSEEYALWAGKCCNT